jgi:DNA polymerase I-like protein with 3'-5' exonuclease and polymerase domains
VLTPEQLQYSADDVAYLHALKQALEVQIDGNSLRQPLDLELALLPIVVDIECRGIQVSREGLRSIKNMAKSEAEQRKTEMCQLLADPHFNPASVKQVLEHFKARGINLPNTTQETLVACQDELAKMVLKHRSAQKREGQAATLLEAVESDGRIHGSFNPLGTETGRFSSSDPNLQNVGRGSLRECFTASPGCKLIVADYSQIELRVAAAVAGEKQMLGASPKALTCTRKRPAW